MSSGFRVRSLPACVVSLLLCLTGCGGTSSQTPVLSSHTAGGRVSAIQGATVVLDWYPNSDHGGLYTAMARGYFANRHLAVVPRVPSDTSAQIRLVAAGRADFGLSYETDLLAARAHHVPVRSVMCIMQRPLDTVMTLRRSGISRPRQLVGKSIGMAGSPSDIPIVQSMMARDGASIQQAHMVNVGYNLLPALLAGRVDAVVGVYWSWEAVQAQQRNVPVTVMHVERWGVPNYCELVLVTAEKTIATRPALVEAMVRALQQGYAYAEAHPDAAWQALHAQDRTLNRRLVTRSLELLKPAITGASTIGWQDPEQWKRYGTWLSGHHILDARVDTSHSFTNQFLQPAVR